ncbi:MAG: hypothetical protein ACYCS1_07860 [Gammaproteobacteria bacterium]
MSSRGTNQIVMAHIVEAPRGHLSGAIVVTTIDPAGTTPNVSNYNIVGSIAGQNVSLKITGALATIAGWFGDDDILVGSLEGGRLTLSKGSQTFTFDRMSEADYQNRVQALQHLQSNIAADRDAGQELKQAAVYALQVNAVLQQYQSWGQARIANLGKVRAWWAGRIKAYSACLARIEPLAEAKVPSWRWQSCVLDIQNDAYDRGQALNEIQKLATQGAEQLTRLNTMIDQGQAKIEEAGLRLHALCHSATHPKRCNAVWKEWKAQGSGMIAPSSVAAFRALAPKVGQALQTDVDTAMAGNAKLAVIAAQIQQVYKKASQ